MWFIRLAVALFIALMVGGVGPAIVPEAAKLAAPFVCTGNEQMTTTSDTYYPEPGRVVVSRNWFCTSESGTRRSVDFLALLVCGGYVFVPTFILMIIFLKRVPPTISVPEFANVNTAPSSIGKPGASTSQSTLSDRLNELNQARTANLITEDEYEKKKKEMLNTL